MKNKILFPIFVAVYAIQSFAILASPIDKPVGWASYAEETTGGASGSIDTASDLTTLNNLLKQSGSLIIFIKGTISGKVTVSSDNKSLLGLTGAKIYGSLKISNRKNIIVRNLFVQGLPCSTYDECKGGDDAVHIQGSKHIWIDHLDISDGQDGNLDCNDTADFITISWCKFSYSNKDKPHKFSNLVGSADSLASNEGKLNITYHHCWWSNWVNQRQPRTRYGKVHVVNNFFDSDSSSYCTNAGYHASVMAENNVYLNQKNPISPDANSYGCTSRGNVFTNCTGNKSGLGTAFEPSKYYDTSFIDPTNELQAAITSTVSGAGATLTWNGAAEISALNNENLIAANQFSIIYYGKNRCLQNNSSKPFEAGICDLSGRILNNIGKIKPGQMAFFSLPSPRSGLLYINQSGNTRTIPLDFLR